MPAYYNENDEQKAAWLRELIRQKVVEWIKIADTDHSKGMKISDARKQGQYELMMAGQTLAYATVAKELESLLPAIDREIEAGQDKVTNLAILVKRLCVKHPSQDLVGKAKEYLKRAGLEGNLLRDTDGDPITLATHKLPKVGSKQASFDARESISKSDAQRCNDEGHKLVSVQCMCRIKVENLEAHDAELRRRWEAEK